MKGDPSSHIQKSQRGNWRERWQWSGGKVGWEENEIYNNTNMIFKYIR